MQHDTILLVDDDPFNIEIMDSYLTAEGYKTDLADGGVRAWELLESRPERYSVILLDRVMPDLGGMEVLEKIKGHPLLKQTPVIMQTSASDPEQISEGIARGVYYYLTKPYGRRLLSSLVQAAIRDLQSMLSLKEDLDSSKNSVRQLDRAQFTFKKIDEGKDIIHLLASASSKPLQIAVGLIELVVNAVEHGNLEISYEEKGRLLAEGSWEKEISRRYDQPGWCDRRVTLLYEKRPGADAQRAETAITITDMGSGFHWQQFTEFSHERLHDSHGRGILMAQNSFKDLRYSEKGNRVTVTFD